MLRQSDLTPLFEEEPYTHKWYWERAAKRLAASTYNWDNYERCQSHYPKHMHRKPEDRRMCSLEIGHEGPHISGLDLRDINYSLFWE